MMTYMQFCLHSSPSQLRCQWNRAFWPPPWAGRSCWNTAWGCCGRRACHWGYEKTFWCSSPTAPADSCCPWRQKRTWNATVIYRTRASQKAPLSYSIIHGPRNFPLYSGWHGEKRETRRRRRRDWESSQPHDDPTFYFEHSKLIYFPIYGVCVTILRPPIRKVLFLYGPWPPILFMPLF